MTSIKDILEAAAKVNHDEFCGCASMAYPDGSSGPGIIDCPLGALLKTIANYKPSE